LRLGVCAEDGDSDKRPVRVLLAEDNAVNQMVAVRLLKKRGYEITVAGTGSEALAAWERNAYDLLLLDVQMPEMDGIEAALEIRRRENGTRRVPIIALTAGAFAEDRLKCLAAGMDDYVTKPIISAELFKVLDRWSPAPTSVQADVSAPRC
jgi:two-component system sensor histidine kinase/response regulator